MADRTRAGIARYLSFRNLCSRRWDDSQKAENVEKEQRKVLTRKGGGFAAPIIPIGHNILAIVLVHSRPNIRYIGIGVERLASLLIRARTLDVSKSNTSAQ